MIAWDALDQRCLDDAVQIVDISQALTEKEDAR